MAALALAAAPWAQAVCLEDTQIAQWVQAYEAKTPAANPPEMSAEDGKCTRNKLMAAFEAAGRKPVGYKAGLTSAAVQKRFNTDQPVWGRLYKGALLANRTVVPASFGARPLFEADMVVRVSSTAINRATTPLQVLNSIDRVVPYIELPDLMVEDPKTLNGASVEAICDSVYQSTRGLRCRYGAATSRLRSGRALPAALAPRKCKLRCG